MPSSAATPLGVSLFSGSTCTAGIVPLWGRESLSFPSVGPKEPARHAGEVPRCRSCNPNLACTHGKCATCIHELPCCLSCCRKGSELGQRLRRAAWCTCTLANGQWLLGMMAPQEGVNGSPSRGVAVLQALANPPLDGCKVRHLSTERNKSSLRNKMHMDIPEYVRMNQ